MGEGTKARRHEGTKGEVVPTYRAGWLAEHLGGELHGAADVEIRSINDSFMRQGPGVSWFRLRYPVVADEVDYKEARLAFAGSQTASELLQKYDLGFGGP